MSKYHSQCGKVHTRRVRSIAIADTVVLDIDQSRDINIPDAVVRVTGDGFIP
jgi:hypothetical protein